MISEVTAEIESAAAEAGVAALVVRLQPPDSTGVYRDVCNHYTTTDAIARTLRHSYAFEYYLIAKDLSWLICANHHGVLFGVGDPVRSRVRSLDV